MVAPGSARPIRVAPAPHFVRRSAAGSVRRAHRRGRPGIAAGQLRADRCRAAARVRVPRPPDHQPDQPGDARPAVRPMPSQLGARCGRSAAVTVVHVGTTTMKFGVSRHGPSAPVASQFGKYDVFTTTGTPVRDDVGTRSSRRSRARR